MTRTFAAIAVAFSLSAFPAFAEEGGTAGEAASGPATSGAAQQSLGMDIAPAGTTMESRTAFWATMTPENQTMVTERCRETDTDNARNRTAEETAFCADVVK